MNDFAAADCRFHNGNYRASPSVKIKPLFGAKCCFIMLANILFSDLFSFLAVFSIANLILTATCALHMVNINLLNGEINLGFTTSG